MSRERDVGPATGCILALVMSLALWGAIAFVVWSLFGGQP